MEARTLIDQFHIGDTVWVRKPGNDFDCCEVVALDPDNRPGQIRVLAKVGMLFRGRRWVDATSCYTDEEWNEMMARRAVRGAAKDDFPKDLRAVLHNLTYMLTEHRAGTRSTGESIEDLILAVSVALSRVEQMERRLEQVERFMKTQDARY